MGTQTSKTIGQWTAVPIMDVSMQELVGDYESAHDVPEWAWVAEHASFSHVENDTEPSVYEFIVNVSTIDPAYTEQPLDVPDTLRPVFESAIQGGAAFILFHND